MNEDVLRAKLEALARCISRIKSRTPANCEELKNDYDSQDIISVNLERAVQTCVDIASHIVADFPEEAPKTMGEVFLSLGKQNVISNELAQKMIKAVGFRNISVHQYQSVDWKIVYSIATKNLDDFTAFSKVICEFSKISV